MIKSGDIVKCVDPIPERKLTIGIYVVEDLDLDGHYGRYIRLFDVPSRVLASRFRRFCMRSNRVARRIR